MHLGYHGGKCCGIKTIHTMYPSPDHNVPAIKEDTLTHFDGGVMNSNARFYKPAAPMEKARRRLHRYIEYLEKTRPRGIIEVVVASLGKGSSRDQATLWQPVLEEYGFKMVNKCENSNSSNIVFVWHRNSGEVEKLGPLPEEAPPKTASPQPRCGVAGCTDCGFTDGPDYDEDECPGEDPEEDDDD